ncbi:MAG: NAD(P)-dependent alcohol dehydrogenase [Thermoanaerobaculia bacterium]|nr:NAD(P)-dependent alcohol dehydrogenase [Thermoanaerobaculia bacterium]
MSTAVTRREVLRDGAAAAVAAAFPGMAATQVLAQGEPQNEIQSVGWAAKAADKPLERFEFTRRGPGPKDVLIDILYCGVCHSDIHQARANLDIPFPFPFPVVPGHEIIGRVRHVGASVTRFEVRDIAGVGAYIGSDGSVPGKEQFSNPIFTYGGSDGRGGLTQGGYSNNIVVDENYALTIPDGIDLPRAAPLLCAGVTTHSPLEQWEVGEGTRVGVVGLGGLGHMALKFAVDRGADVTVFTTSPDKIRDAERMGAREAVVWPLPQEEVFRGAGSLDFILSTVLCSFDMDAFMMMLRIGGVMSNVGLLEKTNPNYLFVNMRQITLTGSLVGSLSEMQEVIDRCHAKKMLPEVEVIPIEKVNEAYDLVMDKKARYRYVIDMSTLK